MAEEIRSLNGYTFRDEVARAQNAQLSEASVTLKNTTETDLNNITETGMYFFGNVTLTNAPASGAGMLLVFYGGESTRLYQKWVRNHDGVEYVRHKLNSTTWSDWIKQANQASVDVVKKKLVLRKESDTQLYIYVRQASGEFFRYEYYKDTTSGSNLNIWRLGSIYKCYDNKSQSICISGRDTDNEGVIYIADDGYVGGYHGHESYTNIFIYVDGVRKYVENIASDIDCNEVKIVVESNVAYAKKDGVAFVHTKQVTFTADGVTINNVWTAQESMTLEHCRGSMFLTKKTVAGAYFDSNVVTLPTNIPSNTTTTSNLVVNKNITDCYFYGTYKMSVTCDYRGGDESKQQSSVTDFGGTAEVKAYFDSYVNAAIAANEVLHASHTIRISS